MATDWTDPAAVKQAVSARKNYFVGVVVVAALVMAAVWFFQRSREKAALGPWEALCETPDGPMFPAQMEIEQLEAAVERTKGTEAEPYARFWLAAAQFNDKRETDAAQTLESLRKDFPDQYLLTIDAPVPRDPSQSAPMVLRTVQELGRYLAASAESPVPTENPLPADRRTVTLVTGQGDRIELTLLTGQSPESCRAFARLASQLEGSTIALAVEDSWIELGLDDAGETAHLEGVEADFPPFEVNTAYHFKGSVAFRQSPFREGPFDRGLKVWLKDDFNADGVSTVFAQVTAGLDVLERLSAAEKSTERATLLATPVEITKVELSVGDLAESGDTQESDSASDGDGSDG